MRDCEDNLLLEVKGLKTYFDTDQGELKAVDDVSFEVCRNEFLGIIGESGCGKSVTARSILRIVPCPPGRLVAGQILYHRDGNGTPPVDLALLPPKGREIRAIRGNEISMIFQEPMNSFGPLNTIGDQIDEAILVHNRGMKKRKAREQTIRLLERVGIPRPDRRADDYPHQFSGGMRQRAMIAMALSCSPRLLLADEPTTALDVTIQAQILDLLLDLQEETGMAVILITHDLAVVSQVAENVLVMYLGKGVEYATTADIFDHPKHPYTRALWRSIPSLDADLTRLNPIKGMVPRPIDLPPGCPFCSRCGECVTGVCDKVPPPNIEVGPGHWVCCHLYADTTKKGGET